MYLYLHLLMCCRESVSQSASVASLSEFCCIYYLSVTDYGIIDKTAIYLNHTIWASQTFSFYKSSLTQGLIQQSLLALYKGRQLQRSAVFHVDFYRQPFHHCMDTILPDQRRFCHAKYCRLWHRWQRYAFPRFSLVSFIIILTSIYIYPCLILVWWRICELTVFMFLECKECHAHIVLLAQGL